MIWSTETKTPHRLSLGGGGTDILSYSSLFGGSLTSVAIDKYIRIIVNRRYVDQKIILRYSKTEVVDKVEQIEHGLIRNCLIKAGISQGIEIVSLSEIPANTGMGSSGTFTVGLLKALYELNGDNLPTQALADIAFEIESETYYQENVNRRGQPVPFGRHDQYVAAFGGFINLEIDQRNQACVNPVHISYQAAKVLREKLMIFYTGLTRSANEPLSEQSQRIKNKQADAQERMHQIKAIGSQILQALTLGHIDEIGPLMRQHWEAKRGVSTKMTTDKIDQWVDIGRQCGSTGEKIMGAGGGGFLLFFVPNLQDQLRLTQALTQVGLIPINFNFDHDGAVVTNKEVRYFA